MSFKLRTLQEKDNEQIALLMNNKAIWDNLKDYIPFPYDVEDADSFIEFSKEHETSKSFAIEFNSILCGIITLNLQDDIYSLSAELGYWVGEEYWGKGLATKAIAQVVQYGFSELTINRIYAGVFEHNKASMKILEKNGFSKDCVAKKAVIKNDKILDEHRYSILKS